jgi:O-acetylserine/cysteine efflux transporter
MWLGIGYASFLSIVYGYFAWSYALGRVGVARTAVYSNLTPIVALAAGWAMLGERPVAPQLAGVLLILTGVFLVRAEKPLELPPEE